MSERAENPTDIVPRLLDARAVYDGGSPTLVSAAAEIAALRRVLAAARCIRHWHDRGEGMVVSAEHVRKLWTVIADHDEATGVPLHER